MELSMQLKRGASYFVYALIFLLAFTAIYVISVEIPGVAFFTPTTNANLSGSTVLLRVNVSNGIENVTNVTFFITRSGFIVSTIGTNNSVNQSFYTFTFDTTTVSGNSSMIITANLTNASQAAAVVTNDVAASITNIIVDNVVPTVSYVGTADGGTVNPGSTDYLNATTTVNFSFIVTDLVFGHMTGPCNVTIDFANSTRGASLNGTTEFANNTNFGLLASIGSAFEGTHDYRVECRQDPGTNLTGNSTSRTLIFDSTPPFINITFLDQTGLEKTEFGPNSEVTIDCKRSDSASGFNKTELLIQSPFDNALVSKQLSFEDVNAGTDKSASQFILGSGDTAELGDYLVECRVTDRAGNLQRRNQTFSITRQVLGSTSAFGIPGFSAPVAKIKINSGVTSDGGRLTSEGISRLMQVGASLKLSIKGQDHTLTVTALTDNSAILTIKSEPLTVTLNKGETIEIDLDRDGTNDLAATFHKRFPPGGKHADLTFALTETPSVVGREGEGKQPTTTPTTPTPIKVSNTGLIVTLLVIVVIIVIGYFMLSRKKK